MCIRKGFLSAAVSLAAAVGLAATIEVSQAKQRYPWNGLVDIDYRITLEEGESFSAMNGDTLEFTMTDNAQTPAAVFRAVSFVQDPPPPLSAGDHRVTWDARADGVAFKSDRAVFTARIVHHPAVYMVIDVSGGSSTDCYPVVYLDGRPFDGFSDEQYKTDKIVLRRIHPGSYTAGSPTGEAGRMTGETQHRVTLTNAFYMGIYEITQRQFENVMGASANTSSYKGDLYKCRPVETVTYGTIRGGSWPSTSAPSADSFIGKLQARCKTADADGNYTVPVSGIDLPTDFQWEYACRAGTATTLYNNKEDCTKSTAKQNEYLNDLCRNKNNYSIGQGGISEKQHTVVGMYEPNAWGLYDMYGNVWEFCRDFFVADAAKLLQVIEPAGPASSSSRVLRGGSFDSEYESCRSARRNGFSSKADDVGFRIMCYER